jgi:hypothetical protein
VLLEPRDSNLVVQLKRAQVNMREEDAPTPRGGVDIFVGSGLLSVSVVEECDREWPRGTIVVPPLIPAG